MAFFVLRLVYFHDQSSVQRNEVKLETDQREVVPVPPSIKHIGKPATMPDFAIWAGKMGIDQ